MSEITEGSGFIYKGKLYATQRKAEIEKARDHASREGEDFSNFLEMNAKKLLKRLTNPIKSKESGE